MAWIRKGIGGESLVEVAATLYAIRSGIALVVSAICVIVFCIAAAVYAAEQWKYDWRHRWTLRKMRKGKNK